MSWGALADTALSFVGSKYQHDLNESSAQRNRDWQERMSNTAHQRQVEDLKKAGLNPILSVNGGAAVTGGSSASANAPAPSNFASTALQTKKLAQEQQLLESSISKNNQDIETGKTLAALQKQSAATGKQVEIANALNNKMGQAGLNNFMKNLKKESKQLDFDIDTQDLKNLNNLINDGLGTANQAKDLINPLKGIKIGIPEKKPYRRLP